MEGRERDVDGRGKEKVGGGVGYGPIPILTHDQHLL